MIFETLSLLEKNRLSVLGAIQKVCLLVGKKDLLKRNKNRKEEVGNACTNLCSFFKKNVFTYHEIIKHTPEKVVLVTTQVCTESKL